MADIIVKITLDEYSDLKKKADLLNELSKELTELKEAINKDVYQFNPHKEIEKR